MLAVALCEVREVERCLLPFTVFRRGRLDPNRLGVFSVRGMEVDTPIPPKFREAARVLGGEEVVAVFPRGLEPSVPGPSGSGK